MLGIVLQTVFHEIICKKLTSVTCKKDVVVIYKFALTARSLNTFNMLVTCDAAGIICGISETSLEISQPTRVPGDTLGEVLLVGIAESTLFRCKDQREERGVIRGFGEKQVLI